MYNLINNYFLEIAFPDSDGNNKLSFTSITAHNKDEFEIIVSFVLDLLQLELQLFPVHVKSLNFPFIRLVITAFKCMGIPVKTSALAVISEYLKAFHNDDTIEVLTNVMEGLSQFYQTLNALISEVPSDEQFYVDQFVPQVVRFCNTIMLSREQLLRFKSPVELKIFVNVFTDVIYQELKFTRLESGLKSMITKLVCTFDFIMYRANYTADTIEAVNALTTRKGVGFDISEIFPILKYSIVLDLEKGKKCTVVENSYVWNMIHKELEVKSKESHNDKYEFVEQLEWIANTFTLTIDATELLTRRHQLRNLAEGKTCSSINFDFFANIQRTTSDIIQRVNEATGIIDDTVEILIELFISLLQAYTGMPGQQQNLTDTQKLFALSVIFLPFFPMLEKNDEFKVLKEFKNAIRRLPAHLLQYIRTCSTRRIAFLKLSTIKKIATLKMSKIGESGSWFLTTITRLVLHHEENQAIVKAFDEKFKDLIVSNGHISKQLIQPFRETKKMYAAYKDILCLEVKNFIVVKRATRHSMSFGYDVFCKVRHKDKLSLIQLDKSLTHKF